jgi:hypothetical protein
MATTRTRRWVRWLLLVSAAVAAGLAILGLLIVPVLFGFLPYAIQDHPVEWWAAVVAVAFASAHFFVRSRAGGNPAGWRTRARERLQRLLDRLDAGSAWALNGGLALAVALFTVFLLAAWAPHYLTWPWCRDEDTFANLAQSWAAGIRPYRDIRAYNFPGHIYLHWLIGRTFGWGHTSIFYAFDAAALVTLGVASSAWSCRLFGTALPGLVANLAFLGLYLNLDYETVAERDWHATLAIVLALMLLEAWPVPGRPAFWIAAALAASALTIRPHVVLFLPAVASAIAEHPRPARAITMWKWAAAFGLFACLGFAPLAAQGLVDDLIRGLHVVAFGGPYSRATPADAVTVLLDELRGPWTIAVLGCLILLWRLDTPIRRPARTWLLALTAAILYRCFHPVQHHYLAHPLALVGSISLALPVARIASFPSPRPLRVLVLALILYEVMPRLPDFCAPRDSILAISSLIRGIDPAEPPPGCRNLWFRPHVCHYEWSDYCRALDYLRRTTSPETEVANVLRHLPFPSMNGPAGRLSPFRAESGICWMWLIDIDLDAPFAAALEQTPDSVVVWSPAEVRFDPRLKLERVTAVIHRCYHPAARFGMIEVWRRSYRGRDATDGAPMPMPGRPASSGSQPSAIARAAPR